MNKWTHVAASGGTGTEEQWLFRPKEAPMAALKRRDASWEASLLCLTGISCTMLYFSGDMTLLEAKAHSEQELWHMGWRW